MTSASPADWIDNSEAHDERLARDVSNAVLRSSNPYIDLVEGVGLPSEAELIRTSAILAVRPELEQRSYAGAIALDEYRHYIAQTYYFEVLGVQLVGHLAALADSLALVHEMGRQAIDESRHAEAFSRRTVATLDVQ